MENLLGGARRDRTADLLHAMQALSQLSYGPKPCIGNQRARIPERLGSEPDPRRRLLTRRSALLLVFDVAADNIGNVGVFFLLLLDESGIIEGFVDLDLFFDVRLRGLYRRLRALRLGVGS